MSNYNLALYYPQITNDNYVRQNVISSSNNLGSISGKGSSTRIFNNCEETTNDNYNLCIESFIAAPILKLPETGFLFNKYLGSAIITVNGNPGTLPPYIETDILAAISRWEKQLTLSPEYVRFVRNTNRKGNPYQFSGIINFMGIVIKEINLYDSVSGVIASCGIRNNLPNTTIFTSCVLNINTRKYTPNLPASVRNDILTHELGHGLGFNFKLESRENFIGKKLLPNIQSDVLNGKIQDNPNCLSADYYPNAVAGYINLGGYKTSTYWDPPPKYIPIFPEDVGHWFNSYLLGINPNPLFPGDYLTPTFQLRGIWNDIMCPVNELTTDIKFYISAMTKGFLLDLYSIVDNKTIRNYKSVGSVFAEVKKPYINVSPIDGGEYVSLNFEMDF